MPSTSEFRFQPCFHYLLGQVLPDEATAECQRIGIVVFAGIHRSSPQIRR